MSKQRKQNHLRKGKPKKGKPVQYDIFSNKPEERSAGLVVFPRIPFFDPIERGESKVVAIPIHYSGFEIVLRRPILSALDYKIFLALMKTGKFVREEDGGYVFHYKISEIRKVADISYDIDWQELERHLYKLGNIWIRVKQDREDGVYISARNFFSKFDIVERNKGKETVFFVRYTKDFIDMMRLSLLYNLPLSTIVEMNKIKNPVVYRLVAYFITQTKPLKWEVFDLLSKLTVLKFDERWRRHKVLKSIEENKETLEKYGITPILQKEGKRKTYILDFVPVMDFQFTIGKAKN